MQSNTKRYAITYENDMVFQHFGKTPAFLMVDVCNKQYKVELMPTNGTGHGALASFLSEHKVDVVVCGGIGQGARDALHAMHIELIAGASGSVEDIIHAILEGSLKNNPSGMCNHHHDGAHHNCGNHSCK